jgi:hypothetical protein
MAEIIARFADGRLLVEESKKCESRYCGSGIPFRIGHIRQIEKVLSVTTDYGRYGLATVLDEARIGRQESAWSGLPQARADTLMVVMRRADGPQLSGYWSGAPSVGLMSGITSGLAYMGELVSGLIAVSGVVKITANVIGY